MIIFSLSDMLFRISIDQLSFLTAFVLFLGFLSIRTAITFFIVILSGLMCLILCKAALVVIIRLSRKESR